MRLPASSPVSTGSRSPSPLPTPSPTPFTLQAYPLGLKAAVIARNFGQLRGGGTRRHKGVDIWRAPVGTPVLAAHSGRVTKIWRSGATGNGLEITSPDGQYRTRYFHLSAPPFVALDAVIPAGKHIGSMGMTGRADGPHLHFELWRLVHGRFRPVNPYALLVDARKYSR